MAALLSRDLPAALPGHHYALRCSGKSLTSSRQSIEERRQLTCCGGLPENSPSVPLTHYQRARPSSAVSAYVARWQHCTAKAMLSSATLRWLVAFSEQVVRVEICIVRAVLLSM
ncbi:hypothetical protein E2C01_019136 [Portunus trituberculatus]|uniref:Uncharacterized protein n=1 Tax=Portunus trituberculatus TaxID=210409 RepID=A0A5B7DY20_PORTR|nr:hypothetical protein [Portunus trituberculatus]